MLSVYIVFVYCLLIIDYWPYNDMIISNYILFVDYEKINYYIWFFKRKASNDLEANISDATLPTTNVKKNTDVPIEENLDIIIRKNPNKLVEENLDITIEENSQTKFQKVDMSSLQLQRDSEWRKQIYTYHVNQQDEIRRHYIKLGPYQPRFKKNLKSKKGWRFQGSWYEYDLFKLWLEYSPREDAVFLFILLPS